MQISLIMITNLRILFVITVIMRISPVRGSNVQISPVTNHNTLKINICHIGQDTSLSVSVFGKDSG